MPHTLCSIAILLSVGWIGCGPRPETGSTESMVPIYRFVGRQLDNRLGTTMLPAVSIADERRFVLRAPPEGVIAWRVPIPHRGGEILPLHLPIPPPYDGAESLFATIHLEHGGETIELERRLYPLQREHGRVHLIAQLTLPPLFRSARSIDLSLRGVAIGGALLERYATEAVTIPPDARLEFGIGFMEAETGNDPVRFEVDLCLRQTCSALFSEDIDPQHPAQRTWTQRSVDLTPYATEYRHFVFRTTRLGRQAPFSLPVWANPTLYAAKKTAPGDFNLILLSIDTLRADHLNAYGHTEETAPFVTEHFARGGTLFEHAIAPATTTAPSHMTMFTALPPSAHGVTDGFKTLPASLPTLAERLRAARLETGAVTENGWVSVHQGFARGFNTFAENKSADLMHPSGAVERTFERGREWLSAHADKRFFLFLHTYQVHAPYAPPDAYANLFSTGEEQPPSEPESMRRHYAAEIRYTDDALRSFWSHLVQLGLSDRTLFVIVSDHGEEFMEHGLLYHGGNLYEESTRVPWLLFGPGIPAGRRIEAPVGLAALTPTLLELLRVEVPAELRGSSLAAAIIGGDEVAMTPVVSEAWVTYQPGLPRRGKAFHPPSYALRSGSFKLHRYGGRSGTSTELYDLSEDPSEQNDLSAKRPDLVDELTLQLSEYEAQQTRRLREREQRNAPNGRAAGLDEASRAKLRALGYVE